MSTAYTIPGYGTVVEIRQENGKYGPESICVCPDPECGKPKLSVNKGERAGAFRCWSCGMRGKVDGKVEVVESPKKKEISNEVRHECIKALVESLEITKEVTEYAESHGISEEIIKRYGIGYSRKAPHYRNPEDAESLGLISKKKGKWVNRFYKRIVFPMSINYRWVYVQGRATNESQNAKFLNMNGTPPLFNCDSSDAAYAQEVYICEGIPDALSMISHGKTNTVAILGANNFDKRYLDFFINKSAVLALDNDKAGESASLEISKLLDEAGVRYRSAYLGDYNDIAEALRDGQKITRPDQERSLVYIRSEENLMLFGYGVEGLDYDLQIGARDIIERKQSLKINLEFMYSSGQTFHGPINLSSISARSTFSSHAFDVDGSIDKKELKLMLNDLHTGIRQQLEVRREEKPKGKEYIPTEQERAEAVEFLRSEKLLFKIKGYLRQQGIVGEEVNKILLYLIFTSRIMQKPISAIVKGLSSSGKTYLMKNVMSLIPPEGLFVIQEATAKAFYYLGEDDLKHKMIVIGEMHGTENSEYSIREAQDGASDGNLVIWTVEKDKDTNEMVTKKKEVAGPCGFVTSTTNPELNPENETRNFSIYVQINEKKIKETMVVLEEKYTGTAKVLPKETITMLHNAQRCLEKGITVRVPYVKQVLDSFPTSHARVMRDRARFFTILETIAILHQHQPSRKMTQTEDGERILEANLADYNIAMTIMNEILVETLYELPPKSKDIYQKVIQMKNKYEQDIQEIIEGDDDSFWDKTKTTSEPFSTTYKEIASEMGMRVDEARRWSKPLRDNGYLEYLDKGGGRGKETHLYPIVKEFYEGFLPKPEEIAGNHPQYWGEKIYDPITGEEWTIENLGDDTGEIEFDSKEEDIH